MKKVWITLIAVVLFTACSEEKGNEGTVKSEEVRSKMAADGWSEEDYKEPEQNPNEKQYTTLAFDTYEHHFGKVFAGTDNKHVFKVTNTGTAPLIITDASATCGCTVPKKPEAPIAPGEVGEIEVIFSPKPSQLGNQSKTVTIKANTDPVITTLRVSAEVMEPLMK